MTTRDSTATGGVRAAFADCLRVPSQRWLLGITLALGAAASLLLALVLDPKLLTYQLFAVLVQLLMSVTLPFLGAVMVKRATGEPGRATTLPAIAAALIVAAAVALFGVAASLTGYLAAGGGLDLIDEPVGVIAAPVLVQPVAQLVGTAMGMLIRNVVVASLATIVAPMSAYFLLSATPYLEVWRWILTPLGAAENLLDGQLRPADLAAWAVVLTLWGVGLNLAGLARRKTVSAEPADT